MTAHCYYCGREAHYICDNDFPQCNRPICLKCAVPQFEDVPDIARGAYCLCKDHAKNQVKRGETMRDFYKRIGA